MKILVLNAGSSSLKYQLIDMEGEKVLAKGLVERIGLEGSKITQKVNGVEYVLEQPTKDHTDGIQLMLKVVQQLLLVFFFQVAEHRHLLVVVGKPLPEFFEIVHCILR